MIVMMIIFPPPCPRNLLLSTSNLRNKQAKQVTKMPTYLGIEGGGTTWKVAIARDRPDNIIEYERFGTTNNPLDTLLKIKVSK